MCPDVSGRNRAAAAAVVWGFRQEEGVRVDGGEEEGRQGGARTREEGEECMDEIREVGGEKVSVSEVGSATCGGGDGGKSKSVVQHVSGPDAGPARELNKPFKEVCVRRGMGHHDHQQHPQQQQHRQHAHLQHQHPQHQPPVHPQQQQQQHQQHQHQQHAQLQQQHPQHQQHAHPQQQQQQHPQQQRQQALSIEMQKQQVQKEQREKFMKQKAAMEGGGGEGEDAAVAEAVAAADAQEAAERAEREEVS